MSDTRYERRLHNWGITEVEPFTYSLSAFTDLVSANSYINYMNKKGAENWGIFLKLTHVGTMYYVLLECDLDDREKGAMTVMHFLAEVSIDSFDDNTITTNIK